MHLSSIVFNRLGRSETRVLCQYEEFGVNVHLSNAHSCRFKFLRNSCTVADMEDFGDPSIQLTLVI